jgi:hypothetical protein
MPILPPSRPSAIAAVAVLTLSATLVAPRALAAQPRAAAAAPAPARASEPSLMGAWAGTASVPLGDSTIVVPVTYTFTQSGTAITGTAVVPGQATGPIGNVVRTGAKVRFRVTAPEGRLLEHDGTFGADGSIEGMVLMDNLPVAKFRIAPQTAPPKK